MRNPSVQGLLIGAVTAAAAWLAGPSSPPGTVGPFPDVVSLLLLIVLSAIAIWRTPTWHAVNRIALMSGLVVGVSTGLRGAVLWSRLDVLMVTIAVVVSFFAVFAVTHPMAWTILAAARKRARV